jgi:hypothetical protein
MKKLRIVVLSAFVLLITQANVWAQCAMCRGSVESQVSAGDTSVAANLNFGILYLFFTPYLIVGVIGFLWYRSSKRNVKKIQTRGNFAG